MFFIAVDCTWLWSWKKETQRAFSMLIQHWIDRKSVEKRKNILMVVEKALKFRQSMKFRRWLDVDISMFFIWRRKNIKKGWKFDVEICPPGFSFFHDVIKMKSTIIVVEWGSLDLSHLDWFSLVLMHESLSTILARAFFHRTFIV